MSNVPECAIYILNVINFVCEIVDTKAYFNSNLVFGVYFPWIRCGISCRIFWCLVLSLSQNLKKLPNPKIKPFEINSGDKLVYIEVSPAMTIKYI